MRCNMTDCNIVASGDACLVDTAGEQALYRYLKIAATSCSEPKCLMGQRSQSVSNDAVGATSLI
jgi:hypothetical protein